MCADPALSSLDERLAATYREAIKAFGGTSPEDSKAGAAVKADQRAWLAARNACAADAACLRTAYERRLAVLGFRPDPAAPAATDRFVGRYDHRGFMEVSILGLRDGQAAVHLTGAHPGDGRWVCGFEGIGRPDAQGRLVVGAPDSDGNGLIILAKGDGGIQVPEIDVNLAASGNWCGAGGWFVLEYARKR
ncbi:lysozyme inhibitor LprI family protein [Azospirillum thermophilum]|uniref:Lysozyme inhibitor LprI-like N-terminal domain-containing protein n=1 Tax=Azospirillum thermophilum TaxID=2202148 RepID=A0A2S2CQY2_9PROT|nr:hypothetical protein DEW08_12225 [Azospirillum thermophilum]